MSRRFIALVITVCFSSSFLFAVEAGGAGALDLRDTLLAADLQPDAAVAVVQDVSGFDPAGGWALVDADTGQAEVFHYATIDRAALQLVGLTRPGAQAHVAGAVVRPFDDASLAAAAVRSAVLVDGLAVGDPGASVPLDSVAAFSAGGGWAVADPGTQAQELFFYSAVDDVLVGLAGLVRPEASDHSAGAPVASLDPTALNPTTTSPVVVSTSPSPAVTVDPPPVGGIDVDPLIPDPPPVTVDPPPVGGIDVDPLIPDPPPVTVDPSPVGGIDLDPLIPDPPPTTVDPPPAGGIDLDPLIPDPPPQTVDPPPAGGIDLDPYIPDPQPITIDPPPAGGYDLDPLIPDPAPITIDPPPVDTGDIIGIIPGPEPITISPSLCQTADVCLPPIDLNCPPKWVDCDSWPVISVDPDPCDDCPSVTIDPAEVCNGDKIQLNCDWEIDPSPITVDVPDVCAPTFVSPYLPDHCYVPQVDASPITIDVPDPCATIDHGGSINVVADPCYVPKVDASPFTVDVPDVCATISPYGIAYPIDQCYVPSVDAPPVTVDVPDVCATISPYATTTTVDQCYVPKVDPPPVSADAPDPCGTLSPYSITTTVDQCYVPIVDAPPVTVDAPDPCTTAALPYSGLPDHCLVPGIDASPTSVAAPIPPVPLTDSSTTPVGQVLVVDANMLMGPNLNANSPPESGDNVGTPDVCPAAFSNDVRDRDIRECDPAGRRLRFAERIKTLASKPLPPDATVRDGTLYFPDIITLQEVNSAEAHDIVGHLNRLTGMQYAVAVDASTHDVEHDLSAIIYSRRTMVQIDQGHTFPTHLSEPDAPKRNQLYVGFREITPSPMSGGDDGPRPVKIVVATVHLANDDKFSSQESADNQKAKWMEDLALEMEMAYRKDDIPLQYIISGDFNQNRCQEIESPREGTAADEPDDGGPREHAIACTPRPVWQRLGGLGYVETVHAANLTTLNEQYKDGVRPKKHRIDHIFAKGENTYVAASFDITCGFDDEGFIARRTCAWLESPERYSDHRIVWARLGTNITPSAGAGGLIRL